MSMMHVTKVAVLILASSFLIASCAGTPARLSQPTDISQGKKFDMAHGRTVSSQACGFQLFLFIPIVTNQRAAIASRRLQAEAGNGYLTDIRVKETWTYAFAGTLYCTVLEGTVYPLIQS